MLISDLFEDEALTPPNAYSLILGKVIAKVIIDVKENYNSLRRIELGEGLVVLEMYAGSNVPVASMMRKHAKEIKLPIYWQFEKVDYGNGHGYEFHFPKIELLPNLVVKGIMSDAETFKVYDDLARMIQTT
jgi:hypothetical protein